MEPEFWHARWEEGQIGFHQPEVHEDLVRFGDLVTDGVGLLVPLCGKSVDLPWLAARVPVVGVELSGIAAQQLFAEHGLQPTLEDRGPFRCWRAGDLAVLEGDVFDLTPELLPFPVDRVWDRAALVALDPTRRARYVAHLRALLPPGGRVLLNAFAYDPGVMDGPPHPVPPAEVRALFAGAAIDVLDEREELSERFRARGHAWWRTTVYRIALSERP
jgi:thiopurine S-methyltransferase